MALLLPPGLDKTLSALEQSADMLEVVPPSQASLERMSDSIRATIRSYKESCMLSGGTFICAASHNSPGRSDATGAFIPEAKAYRIAVGETSAVRLFDNSRDPMTRLHDVCRMLEEPFSGHACAPLYRNFAFFCHGLKSGLQFGVNMKTLGLFADSLTRVSCKAITIALYACSAGADGDTDASDETAPGPGGEGGLADALRDAMCQRGVMATVYAHATPGHATTNPYVRVFSPETDLGGEWLIEPGSRHWAAWRKGLQTGKLRYMYPHLSRELLLEAIHHE